jgi:hypothetical protein
VVGQGWLFRQVFSAGGGVIYAITDDDEADLLWYKHLGCADGSPRWMFPTGQRVGNGWNLRQVFPGGDDGVIYAIAENGDLFWYKHTGRDDGTFRWAFDTGRKVGSGWIFRQVFCTGNDGVIYAIRDNGDLLWFRHDGRNDGTFVWAANSGAQVGSGWIARQVFSGGSDGVIYSITTTDGADLMWFKHLGRNDGTPTWVQGTGRRVGNGWVFRDVFGL